MRGLKGIAIGVVGIAMFVALGLLLFNPTRSEYLRVAVTLHGNIDGNGGVHDLQLVVGDNAIPCTPAKDAVYCSMRDPAVQSLLQKARKR